MKTHYLRIDMFGQCGEHVKQPTKEICTAHVGSRF